MRTRINVIALMSLCLLVSACERAKMRTVPRQNAVPSAALQSAPVAPPQDDGIDQPARANNEPEQPLVQSAPPAAGEAVARLDDSPEPRQASGPARAPRRDVIDDGELNRPRPRPRQSAPREEAYVLPECPPGTANGSRASAPSIRVQSPRARVQAERMERIEGRQQFELDPNDELHCRWEPTGSPMTYLKYDPATRTAFVQHGYPQRWDRYSQVRLVTGLPPYGEEGLTLVNKHGVEIAHLKPSLNGRVSYERDASYPYEALFGRVPGGPRGEPVRGVCWTKSEPARISESGNTGSGN